MNITNLPISPLVDKTGAITPEWRNSLQQTITQLQTFLSNEKYQLPLQPTLRQATDTDISGLDIQSNYGAINHNPVTNTPMVNIQTYTAADPTTPGYNFNPIPVYQNVATLDDLNAIPMNQINSKLITVTAVPNTAYLGVGTSWQTITTTPL